MTYANYLYIAGKAILEVNQKLFQILKNDRKIQIQTEHVIAAIYN